MEHFQVQPLDAVLKDLRLTAHDLVKISKEQLTYKQVHKARTGRSITLRIKGKIIRALNACLLSDPGKKNLCSHRAYTIEDLFWSNDDQA